jgi:acrylyl-CoA reductase (NADPH)
MSVRAIVATGAGPASVVQIDEADLPAGDVTVDVAYSSLNYKDGLAVTGTGKVARSFPMVCGIDLAGTVSSSSSAAWHEGDEVVLTGWGLSETHPGGYTERQRVDGNWLVARPAGLTLAQTMAVGTAGLTAMLCVLALERAGVDPGGGDVLVTGASGGVGSVAVAVLARLGYAVTASTGRPELHDYLRSLVATGFVDRGDLAVEARRPLESETWAGAIDSVGGTTLASVLRQTRYNGAVAACGLAGGSDVPASVFPFILRGVSLLGVESVRVPMPRRSEAWARLAADLPVDILDAMTTVAPLDAVPSLGADILAGRTRGRVVVDVRA